MGIIESDAIFNAFPNPFNDFIKISFEGESKQNLELTLFDVQGKNIQKQNLREVFDGDIITFKTVDLPAGMYYLNIQNENGFQEMIKMVRQ